MELGTKSDSSGPLSISEEDKPKTHYPSFTLNGDKREEFLKSVPDAKEVGYEFTAPCKLRVSGNTDDKYSKSLSLDVISLDHEGDEEGKNGLPEGSPEEEASETPEEEAGEQATGDTSDEDDEEKILGYRRPKFEKPAHEASGKDLME